MDGGKLLTMCIWDGKEIDTHPEKTSLRPWLHHSLHTTRIFRAPTECGSLLRNGLGEQTLMPRVDPGLASN